MNVRLWRVRGVGGGHSGLGVPAGEPFTEVVSAPSATQAIATAIFRRLDSPDIVLVELIAEATKP